MSRYIDYDAIDYRNDKLHDKSKDFLNGVYYMAERIEEAPSIDIVRCRECRFYDEKDSGYCDLQSIEGWKADDFCPYGERSER